MTRQGRVLHKVCNVFLKKSGIWYTYLFQLKGHKILSLQYIIPPLVLGMMHKIFRVWVLLANHLDIQSKPVNSNNDGATK